MKKIYLPRDFFSVRTILFPDWVSNGHIAVRRERILNAGDFASKEMVQRWMQGEEDEYGDCLHDIRGFATNKGMESVFAQATGSVTPFRITDERFFHGNRDRSVAAYRDIAGLELKAFFAEHYLDALGFVPGAIIYGVGPEAPFMDTEEVKAASIFLMPIKPKGIEAEAKKFNQETGERIEGSE